MRSEKPSGASLGRGIGVVDVGWAARLMAGRDASYHGQSPEFRPSWIEKQRGGAWASVDGTCVGHVALSTIADAVTFDFSQVTAEHADTVVADAYRLWQTVDREGERVAVSRCHRFVPALQLARSLVESSRLGALRAIEIHATPPSDAAAKAAGCSSRVSMQTLCFDLLRFLGAEVSRVAVDTTNGTERVAYEDRNGVTGFVAIAATDERAEWAMTVRGNAGAMHWDMSRPACLDIACAAMPGGSLRALEPMLPEVEEAGSPANSFQATLRRAAAAESVHVLRVLEGVSRMRPLAATLEDAYRDAEISLAIERSRQSRAPEMVRDMTVSSRDASKRIHTSKPRYQNA